ncbi:UNVERIFIED_CONTAM: hypothetical protein NCL1_28069 [Trichonephila clavipes]
MYFRNRSLCSCQKQTFHRWRETSQVHCVWQGFQPILQPHHPQQETHGVQTLCLRHLWPRLPTESGPQATQRDATFRSETTALILTGLEINEV